MLVPLYSVFSVCSVVYCRQDNHGIHRKHGEDIEQEKEEIRSHTVLLPFTEFAVAVIELSSLAFSNDVSKRRRKTQ